MAIITPEQYTELEDRIDKIYDVRKSNLPNYMEQLYTISDTDMLETRHLGIGSMAKAAPWGGTVEYDGYSKGFETDYRQARYSTGIQLDERIFRYKGNFGEIAKRTIKAADAIYKTKEYYGASVFNNAFDDSFTSRGDSVGLCSTAHPYSPTDATTQSNEGTLALNVANFETTRKAMMSFRDDKGDLMVGIIPNILLVGTEQLKTAKQIVGGEYDAFQADYNINIYNGNFQVMYNPHITGKKWFMIAGLELSENLNWYYGRRAKPERENDFDTESVKFKLVTDFAFGWDSPLFCYGQNPTT